MVTSRVRLSPSESYKTIAQFCDAYGLYRPLVPITDGGYDPVRLLQYVRDKIESLPKTAATFKPGSLFDELGLTIQEDGIGGDMLYICGAYPERQTNSTRWVNPNYVHLDSLPSVTESDARDEIVEHAVKYGVLSFEDLAPRFGITPSGVESAVHRSDIDWRYEKYEARKRIGRTAKTLLDWELHEYKPIASALGASHNAVRWMTEPETIGEYEPPVQPTVSSPYELVRDPNNENRYIGEFLCGRLRRRAFAGEYVRDLTEKEWAPDSRQHIRRHISGGCDCRPDHPPVTYDRSQRTWVIANEGAENNSGVVADD